MRIGRRTRLLVSLGFAAVGVLVLVLWCSNRFVVIHEKATPDRFDLGRVTAGSHLELSVRLLTSANKSPLEVFFERIVGWLPNSWRPTLWKLHPSRLRKAAPTVDLLALKPDVEIPSFVHLEKVVPQQRADRYDNRPYFVLYMTADAARTGAYSGQLKLRLNNREASLPIELAVMPPPAKLLRVLIAQTPYSSDETEYGSDLDAATMVLASLKAQIDCLHQLPAQLEVYQTILLAEDALLSVKDEQVSRLQKFVRNGGRLVIACNAFLVGTVANANEIIADYGLKVVDKDYTRTATVTTVTNIVQDVLTKGIRRLGFFRPSLIQVTDPSKARIIAPAPTQDGGFVAVSSLANGGEIIVLAQSLWWHRLESATNGADNARLLRNLLMPGMEQ